MILPMLLKVTLRVSVRVWILPRFMSGVIVPVALPKVYGGCTNELAVTIPVVVMLPVLLIGFEPNAARLAATLALPNELVAMPVSNDPLPMKKLPDTLPVADIRPTVVILPALALPVTARLVNVPTLVMLACAAVVTVPAVVAVVALATVPVTLAPVIEVNRLPLPAK